MNKQLLKYSSIEEVLSLVFSSRVKKIEIKQGDDIAGKIKNARFEKGIILLLFPAERSVITEWLELIKRVLNVTWGEIAQFLGVKERTVQRWKREEAFPRLKNLNKLKALKEICFFLSKYPEALKMRFLNTKDPHSRRTPLELLRESKIEEVLEKLYHLAEGGTY